MSKEFYRQINYIMIVKRMGLFKSRGLHKRNVLLVILVSISVLCAQTPVQKYGQLKIQGNKILDQNNSPAQLRGMSFFWSQWIGKYYNYNTVKWLRDDWCSSVVRAAMAVDNDGYATYPDEEKAKVYAVIDAAIELGIYVIVDFHVHEANLYKTEAKTFFAEVAQKYGNQPNIIYEIWNEPLDVSWSGVIKPYHNEVVAAIRQYDPDNIIVCGTRLWSQRVDEAANDPVTGTNIAYTLHYYANTHGQTYRDYCSAALGKNAAVFVTEYGTCSADGGGTVNVGESNNWWSFLDQNKISYCNWSLADKVEAASALQPNASINGNWTTSDLTTSGTLVRNYYKSKCDFTIPKNITTSLTAPANNTSLGLGATVTATANASTTTGTITKLAFYVDDVLVGTDTVAPYTQMIPSLAIGKHTIYAIAYNSLNESVSTNTVNVVVETPVFKTSTAPLVDGTIDAVWSNVNVPSITINKLVSGTVASATDLSGTFKTLWDNTYLYILGNITDNTKVNDSPEVYNDDAVEIFVDINNDKASTYGANDVQYTFGWNDGTVISPNPTGRITTGITYAMLAQTGGYIFEARIPWTTLKGTPTVGQKLGFDFHINDDDDGDGRDAKIAWNSSSDNAWQDPSLFGAVVLQDLIPCPLPSGVGTIVGNSALCTGATASYSITGITGANSYAWVLPTGVSLVSGSGTASVSLTVANTASSGSIVVTPSNTCGNATSVSMGLNINPLPSAANTPSGNIAICEGSSVLLNAPSGTNLAYTWRKDNVTVSNAPNYLVQSSGLYTLQVTNTATNCSATSVATSVSANKSPQVKIIQPIDSAFVAPASFTLTAEVTVGTVSKVLFYKDNTFLGEDLTSPYSMDIVNLTSGDYIFKAIALTEASCADTALRRMGSITSLQNADIKEEIAVYPNPFEEQIQILLDGSFEYNLLNLAGMELIHGSADDKLQISADVPRGMYLLRLTKEGNSKLIKLEKY